MPVTDSASSLAVAAMVQTGAAAIAFDVLERFAWFATAGTRLAGVGRQRRPLASGHAASEDTHRLAHRLFVVALSRIGHFLCILTNCLLQFKLYY